MTALDDLYDLDSLGPDRLKALIYGEPGTGKTTLLSTMATSKTPMLYVDLLGEQGSASIPEAARPHIRLVRPRSVEQLNGLFWALQNGEVSLRDGRPVKVVGVESLSALNSLFVRFHHGREEDGPRPIVRGVDRPKQRDGRQVYSDVADDMRDFATFWFSLADATKPNPLHVVMTSQSKRHEIREKSADPNTIGALVDVFIAPDVSPASVSGVLAPPDFVLYTFTEAAGVLAGGEMRRCVRSGPHDLIRTKIHGDLGVAEKWPEVIGNEEEPRRLTLPVLCKAFKIPL